MYTAELIDFAVWRDTLSNTGRERVDRFLGALFVSGPPKNPHRVRNQVYEEYALGGDGEEPQEHTQLWVVTNQLQVMNKADQLGTLYGISLETPLDKYVGLRTHDVQKTFEQLGYALAREAILEDLSDKPLAASIIPPTYDRLEIVKDRKIS